MIPNFFDFTPTVFLRNPHLMTLAASFWPRHEYLAGVPTEARLFTTVPRTQLLGFCHWQHDPTTCQTVILVHGLEGSSESPYMRGIGSKAYRAGMNVIRLNQRTCGGTEHLTDTLYNSGLSEDYRAIINELEQVDRLEHIWLVGYSMGGNLVLKVAGETDSSEAALAGVIAVCPNIDPAQCVKALEAPQNWIYHDHFLRKLKVRMRRKAGYLPGKWNLIGLEGIQSMSEFDNRYTAPDGGYLNAADYYERVGARLVLGQITVPTIIITAQDDPFIPFSMFSIPSIHQNPHINLMVTQYGGHCGFIQAYRKDEDRFWIENRIITMIQVSKIKQI